MGAHRNTTSDQLAKFSPVGLSRAGRHCSRVLASLCQKEWKVRSSDFYLMYRTTAAELEALENANESLWPTVVVRFFRRQFLTDGIAVRRVFRRRKDRDV